MRKRFDVNPVLNLTPIEKVRLPLKSRDELPPILAGLQWIFITPEINEQVFDLISKDVLGGRKNTGRPGMDLWHILVLASVRLGLDIDFDKLEDLANHHKLIRLILGVDDIWHSISFKYNTVRDNISLVKDDTLYQINAIVANYGRRLHNNGKDKKMCLKTDSYVFESNVHFPTDLNLAWDCIRKCITMISEDEKLCRLGGWRKHAQWMSKLKSKYRSCSCTVFSGGKNKEQRVRIKTIDLLEGCIKLSEKIEKTLTAGSFCGITRIDIEYFHSLLKKHIDLITRRLLNGEKIPHEEKLFSVFETHTEWLTKGKKHPSVELGHRLLITTDENDMIIDYKVMIDECDSDQVYDLIQRIEKNYGENSIYSMSFDKGFSSKPNREYAKKHAEYICMPKKGKRNKLETEEERQVQFVKLRHKHSAVESNINCLEHHGLDRCPDKGINGYTRYAGVGILAYNLHKIGNFLTAQKLKEEKVA
jgi:transposase, IS5 family